jgi:hypothetical protein
MLKREGVIDSAYTFLNRADAALNIPNMFVGGGGVEGDAEAGQLAAESSKGIIHQSSHNAKTTTLVELVNGTKAGENCHILLIRQRIESNKA